MNWWPVCFPSPTRQTEKGFGPGPRSWPYYLLPVWPWVSCLAFLRSSLTPNWGIPLRPISRCCCEAPSDEARSSARAEPMLASVQEQLALRKYLEAQGSYRRSSHMVGFLELSWS